MSEYHDLGIPIPFRGEYGLHIRILNVCLRPRGQMFPGLVVDLARPADPDKLFATLADWLAPQDHEPPTLPRLPVQDES